MSSSANSVVRIFTDACRFSLSQLCYALMLAFMKKHPLATVLITAIVLRTIAVIFSKGYMASDDHYETIRVAYNWLLHGFFASDGTLTWGFTTPRDIARFPLYALSLWSVMKTCTIFGVTDLDSMMYAVRAAHALVSLIGVWSIFRLVKLVTASDRWAIAAGMIMAAHAAMPFLSVRSLIEMVGGNIWIVALLLLYVYDRDKRPSWLLWSGILSGLAWMIRFELAFAVLPVPFIIWFKTKELRPAMTYTLALFGMLLFSGMIDYALMGRFAASTINHLRQVTGEGIVYATSLFIYPAVLLAFFIPPVSLVAFGLSFRRRFWSEHSILVMSNLFFVLIHTLSPSRQERYMIPIIPAMTAMLVLAVWSYHREREITTRQKRWLLAIAIPTIVLNVILLAPFTINYSHRGLIEPLKQIGEQDPGATILLVSPDLGQIYPLNYGYYDSKEIGRRYVNRWSDLGAVDSMSNPANKIGYAVLYPLKHEDLQSYKDSISIRFPKMTPIGYVGPSSVDRILHWLNPKHNRRNDAWLYRTSQEKSLKGEQ